MGGMTSTVYDLARLAIEQNNAIAAATVLDRDDAWTDLPANTRDRLLWIALRNRRGG